MYQDKLQLYASIVSIGSFVGSLLSNLISGLLIDFFQKRSEMTIPMLCTVKAILDIPFCYMTYGQQSNFDLSIAGVLLQLVIAKGWTAPAILILKTVVDPRVSNISIAMFLFFQNIVNTLSSKLTGQLTHRLHPASNPHEYGKILSYSTILPCALSIPFFLISGCKMKKINEAKNKGLGVEEKKQAQQDIKSMVRNGSVMDTDFNNFSV